jgi:hypothetical protein
MFSKKCSFAYCTSKKIHRTTDRKKKIEGTKFKKNDQGPKLHTNDIKETKSVVQPKTKYPRLLRKRYCKLCCSAGSGSRITKH